MPRADDPPDVQVVVARLEAIHETLEEVHEEVRRTNGRVTALETARAVTLALEARSVTDKDWKVRWLLVVVAVGSWLSPTLAHFLH